MVASGGLYLLAYFLEFAMHLLSYLIALQHTAIDEFTEHKSQSFLNDLNVSLVPCGDVSQSKPCLNLNKYKL